MSRAKGRRPSIGYWEILAEILLTAELTRVVLV